MTDKVVIATDTAPAPIGPYSQAIKVGNLFVLAGQIGLDPQTGKLAGEDAASQTRQILKNIENIVTFAGLTPGHIVRCTIYVVDLKDMEAVNGPYAEFFYFQPPVRTTVQVAALPAGARVEIEATAHIPAGPKSSSDRL